MAWWNDWDDFMKKLKNEFEDILGFAFGTIRKMWNWISDVWTMSTSFVKRLWDGIESKVSDAIDTAKDAVVDGLSDTISAAKDAYEFTSNFAENTMTTIKEWVGGRLHKLAKGIFIVMDSVELSLRTAISGVTDSISSTASDVTNAVVDPVKEAVNDLTDTVTDVTNTLENLKDEILESELWKDPLGWIGGQFWDLMQAVIS